jgi:hypothetical protein
MMKNKREVVAKSSIRFFENGMRGHSAVCDIVDIGDNQYILKRTEDRSDLKILVADIYIAGEADIYEINPTLHGIDCIVLIGFYNRYSYAAKDLAKEMNVGLYDNREFFGAVNFTGKAFLNYKRKAKEND